MAEVLANRLYPAASWEPFIGRSFASFVMRCTMVLICGEVSMVQILRIIVITVVVGLCACGVILAVVGLDIFMCNNPFQ